MKVKIIVITAMVTAISNIGAQESICDALKSSPAKTEYMKGFPPPPEKRINARDGSFFKFPALRYSVVHMREFMPTVNVPRGNDVTPYRFPRTIDNDIDKITFTPTGTDNSITWSESLPLNYTDGIVILHKGKIIYEKFFAEFTPERVHAVMSVTKSLTGTIASILVAEGTLDTTKLVSEYIPQLLHSGFGDATVREVMDMTTALKYSEDYNDPDAEVWKFSTAGNAMIEHPVGTAQGFYDYLPTIVKDGEHGNIFGYRTANAEVLGWIVATVSGKSVAQLLTELIWSRLGMEQDAYYQVDAFGTPFAGGGLNASLHDLACFGEMMRRGGNWQQQQIIPRKAIEDIVKGGDKEAFAASIYGKTLKGWSYRNMWWITGNNHGAYMARGVHGQAIYIDPTAEMVIVRLASSPKSSNLELDATSLPAYEAVADYLLKKDISNPKFK